MSDPWFRPKERGLGAGIPLNWKGWALFGAYVAAILATPQLLEIYYGYEADWPTKLAAVARAFSYFRFFMWLG